jgi:hypothetical protein
MSLNHLAAYALDLALGSGPARRVLRRRARHNGNQRSTDALRSRLCPSRAVMNKLLLLDLVIGLPLVIATLVTFVPLIWLVWTL